MISPQPFYRFRRKLAQECTLSLRTYWLLKNSNFEESKMAAGRHFEDYYVLLYLKNKTGFDLSWL